jgi:hypothetical protein
MFVKLDEEVIFEIDDVMIKLLSHDLIDPIEEIKRRLRYIIEHKCDQTFMRMEKEYKQTLSEDQNISFFPKNRREMAELIFQHPSYKNRKQREEEALLNAIKE